MILAYMCMQVIMISNCKIALPWMFAVCTMSCHFRNKLYEFTSKHTYLESEVLHTTYYRTKLIVIPRALRLCYIQGGSIKMERHTSHNMWMQ